MSILDSQNIFELIVGTAITASATSTHILDLGIGTATAQGRDPGAGYMHGAYSLIAVLSGFTSSATNTTLNTQIQAAPDNGSGLPGGWATI